MRLLINSMTFLMAVAIVYVGVLYMRAGQSHETNFQTVRDSLDAFDEQLTFHAAMWHSEAEQVSDYPPQIQPEWFKEGLPSNPLLTGARPWIDIAPAEDYSEHPPNPLAVRSDRACFWYNPNLGIIRARVPRQASDRLTLQMYNRVNQTDLAVLPYDTDPDRAPLAFNPELNAPAVHASLEKQTTRTVQTAATEPEAQEEVPWYEKRVIPPGFEDNPVPSDHADPAEADPPDEPARPSLLSE